MVKQLFLLDIPLRSCDFLVKLNFYYNNVFKKIAYKQAFNFW